MKGIVISNAGPLIVLAKLNQLHLLRELYGQVYFSSAVYDEVVTVGIRKGYDDAKTLKAFFNQEGWTPIDAGELPNEIGRLNLDSGEKETIALALKKQTDLLLMDEERGRREARRLNLLVRGSMGILIEAYKKGVIDEHRLSFYFTQVKSRDDLWISTAFIDRLITELNIRS